MSNPIVFISHNKIKEGKLEEFKRTWRDMMEFMEAEKPRTLVYLGYVNEDESEVSLLHVLPDVEAMDLHMQGARERAKGGTSPSSPSGWSSMARPAPSLWR